MQQCNDIRKVSVQKWENYFATESFMKQISATGGFLHRSEAWLFWDFVLQFLKSKTKRRIEAHAATNDMLFKRHGVLLGGEALEEVFAECVLIWLGFQVFNTQPHHATSLGCWKTCFENWENSWGFEETS